MRITGNAVVDRAILGRGGRRSTYTQRMLALFGASTIIGLWTQGEASGTTCVDSSGNGRNGTYTGVQLAQPGVDRFTSAKYDGATSYAALGSASLIAAFPGQEGTLGLGMRVASASILTDATNRRLVHFGDTSLANRLLIERTTTNNTFQFRYQANSVNKAVTFTTTSTSWLHVAMTWSKSGDKFIAYVNGTQTGTTQTGLGAWNGTVLAAQAVIGSANTVPQTVWSGYLQYVTLLNRAATASEIAQMARTV